MNGGTASPRFHEPLRVTLRRTVGIALVGGAVLAYWWGGLARWPIASAVMLWPSLGGHVLDVWFLNSVRPRLPDTRSVRMAARLAIWFVGGIALAAGMWFTMSAFAGRGRLPWALWWAAGLAFIGVELVAQLALQLRGQPSFFNGRG